MASAIAFAVAMAVALAIVRMSGTPSLNRAGWAMAGNMALVWAAQALSGSYTPWLAFTCIDAATAFVVLAHPAGRSQAMIGAIYVLQIITHVAFGAAGAHGDARFYLDLLAFGGGCQLLILATGAIHGRRRKVRRTGLDGGGAGGTAAADLARVEIRP